MLILTREIGKSIIIDNNIKICVLGFTKRQVKLGIEAPKNISVHREEIQQKVDNENQQITERVAE